MGVDATEYQTIRLKPIFRATPPAPQQKGLMSLTKDWRPMTRRDWTVGAETYSSLVENGFIPAVKYPGDGVCGSDRQGFLQQCPALPEYGKYDPAGCGSDRGIAQLLQFRVYGSASGQLFCVVVSSFGMSLESGKSASFPSGVCAKTRSGANPAGQSGVFDRCVRVDGPAEQASADKICF